MNDKGEITKKIDSKKFVEEEIFGKVDVDKIAEEEIDESIERIIKRAFQAHFQRIYNNPEYKNIQERALKKGLKYYWMIGIPFIIGSALLFVGIKDEPTLLQTSTIVAFTMFGVLVGLYIAHESIGNMEKLSALVFFFPKANKKKLEKIFAGYVMSKMDLFAIISYFILGLISSIAQAELL